MEHYDGQVVSYTNWAKGEPNRDDEDYVHKYKSNGQYYGVYDKGYKMCDHYYTMDKSEIERGVSGKNGSWQYEGISYYAIPESAVVKK